MVIFLMALAKPAGREGQEKLECQAGYYGNPKNVGNTGMANIPVDNLVPVIYSGSKTN